MIEENFLEMSSSFSFEGPNRETSCGLKVNLFDGTTIDFCFRLILEKPSLTGRSVIRSENI